MKGFEAFLVTLILSLAAGQIPTPLSNGNAFTISGNAAVGTVTSTSSSTLTLTFSNGLNGTFSVDGSAASTTGTGTEYYGRFTTLVGGVLTFIVGMCFRVTPITGSTTVVGLTYRSNSTTFTTVTANMVTSITPGVAVTQAQVCNAGGYRPEYETALLDFSSGSFTALTCPAALGSVYNVFAVSGATCGIGGVTISGSTITFNTTSCSAATTFFGSSSTSLECLHSFNRGHDFLHLANSTSTPVYYYCISYAVNGNDLDLTIVKNYCNEGQTPTFQGNSASTGNWMVVKLQPNATTADSGEGRLTSNTGVTLLMTLATLLLYTMLS